MEGRQEEQDGKDALPKRLELPPTSDFHVHLRDGQLMELVVPTIREGGCDTVYVMPNLTPPITTVAAALAYHERLQKRAPDVKFLMTLYLHPTVTPEVIAEAAQAGIAGVKAYPRGQTTNSELGVVSYEHYFPVFAAMEVHDLVLNLHGERPPTPASKYVDKGGAKPGETTNGADEEAVTVLNAEAAFLPTLHKIHQAFPKLRIVLEHATTAAALVAVRACGPTVAATVTAHHLWLTVDDWCCDAGNYCKPVAKTPSDRVALVREVVAKDSKVFFGSDSAPHPMAAKAKRPAAAGVFTQKYATQLVVGAVEKGIMNGWLRAEDVGTEDLRAFLRERGRRFYKLDDETGGAEKGISLESRGEISAAVLRTKRKANRKQGGMEVPIFRGRQPVWSLEWQ